MLEDSTQALTRLLHVLGAYMFRGGSPQVVCQGGGRIVKGTETYTSWGGEVKKLEHLNCLLRPGWECLGFGLEAETCITNPTQHKKLRHINCLRRSGGSPSNSRVSSEKLKHPMCLRWPGYGFVYWVTEVYAWQHVYYNLSLSESDRLRLVVNMFTELVLLRVMATSDLHPTRAIAHHPLHKELAGDRRKRGSTQTRTQDRHKQRHRQDKCQIQRQRQRHRGLIETEYGYPSVYLFGPNRQILHLCPGMTQSIPHLSSRPTFKAVAAAIPCPSPPAALQQPRAALTQRRYEWNCPAQCN